MLRCPDETLGELMSAYQRGDIRAFEELYESVQYEIRGYFSARCPDSHRVEDLVQEFFLQLHRSRRTYFPDLPVRPWMYAIAKRVLLMHLRRLRRKESRELTGLVDACASSVPSCADSLAARSILRGALRRISRDARRAFLLHHWFGMSFREIASVLNVTNDAAKVRSSRAVQRLRVIIRED